MNHVMVDLETMGTTPGCAILSIGAVKFDPENHVVLGEYFYETVSIESCLKARLKIEADTFKWWLTQDEVARQALCAGRQLSIQDALAAFWTFFRGSTYLWSHGANFDVPVLDVAHKRAGRVAPWNFWDVRDTRTLFDLAGGVKVIKTGVVHHARVDAENQARAVIEAYRILGKAKYLKGV